MHYRTDARPVLVFLVGVIVYAISFIPSPGSVQAQEPGDPQVLWQVDFPRGEEQVVRRHTFTRDALTFGMLSAVTHVDGPGPLLIEAAVTGPSCTTKPLHFADNNAVYNDGFWEDLDLGRNTYSRLFTNQSPNATHQAALALFFADGSDLYLLDEESRPVPNAPEGWACEIIVRVSRILDGCTMWASTRGDVNQEAYGHVAYFNTFANGVPITTGTIADPGMHQELENFGAFMEGMAQIAQQMGHEVPGYEQGDGDGPPSPSFSMQQMRDELFAGGGDRFGLTLTDVNSEAARQETGDDAMMEFGKGLAVLAGSFTLEASAPGSVEILENPDTSIDLETGVGSLITVPLSTLRVVPGGLDGELNRVPFVYKEGQGSAILTIEALDKDFIVGQVGGELYSEEKYDGRHLSIEVAATFAARRGFKSCMR